MQAYLDGQLPDDLQQKVKAFLQENPFEAEAMEGLTASSANLSEDLEELEARVQKRIPSTSSTSLGSWWRVAAAVLLLALSGVLVYYFLPDNSESPGLAVEQETIAEETVPNEEVSGLGATENPVGVASGDELYQQDPAASEGEENKISANARRDNSQSLSDSQPEEQEEPLAVIEPPRELQEVALADDMEDGGQLADADEELSRARSSAPQKLSPKSKKIADGYVNKLDSVQIPYDFQVVVGKVISSQTGSPLAGAQINVKGTDINTLSDQNGFFHLEAPLDASTLISSNIGFDTREVTIREQAQIDVVLDEQAPQLEEVAPAGAAVKNEARQKRLEVDEARFAESIPPLPTAQPPANLETYLQNNTTYPQRAAELGIEGQVILAFKVLANGTLTDFQIVQKLGFGCDEEAVKVLQNGPAWIPFQTQGRNVTSQAQYPVNFPSQ